MKKHETEEITIQTATTKTIHRQLQEIALRELKAIPEYIEKLTPAERVRFILAVLPYTAPRIETCRATYGDDIEGWNENGCSNLRYL